QSSDVTYSILNGTEGSFTAGSFRANAYASSDDSQIVIAFRGTDLNDNIVTLLKNILADISFVTGVVNANLLNYVEDAAQFVRSIEAAFPHASITLTGHSLGGAIAQIISAASGLSASVFNAPGVGTIYGQMTPVLGAFSPINNSDYVDTN